MNGAVQLLSSETIRFLAELRDNNDRAWFAAHKQDYEQYLQHPGEAFAAALACELKSRTGHPHDYRIFRIHRDVRFAADKSPYNAHLHISLSADGGCQNGGPVWMFGFDPDGLTLGAGIFAFTPGQLEEWRRRCAGEDGQAGERLVAGLTAEGIRIPDPELKRVPAPFPADHVCRDLLRRKGLTAWIDLHDAALAFGASGPADCVDRMWRLRPVIDRLAKLD